MKKLLTKFLCYCCLLALLLTAGLLSGVRILSSHRQYSDNYLASTADKLKRLESISGPKLILVGNSNVAFGIDSSILEETLGMPVVNLGVHGGLGDVFHYNMAKRNICQGDIVVLLNTHFGDGLITQTQEAWAAIENGSDYWKLVPPENWLDMLLSFPAHIERSINTSLEQQAFDESNSVYSRAAFNIQGDNCSIRETSQIVFSEGMLQVPEVTEQGIAQINAMDEFCRQQGAVCLVAGYPIATGEFTPPREEFLQMQQQLENGLACSLISDYEDYFYDYQYFYDTQYHLTTEGVRMRTEQLAEDILRWQSSQNVSHS